VRRAGRVPPAWVRDRAAARRERAAAREGGAAVRVDPAAVDGQSGAGGALHLLDALGRGGVGFCVGGALAVGGRRVAWLAISKDRSCCRARRVATPRSAAALRRANSASARAASAGRRSAGRYCPSAGSASPPDASRRPPGSRSWPVSLAGGLAAFYPVTSWVSEPRNLLLDRRQCRMRCPAAAAWPHRSVYSRLRVRAGDSYLGGGRAGNASARRGRRLAGDQAGKPRHFAGTRKGH
jgi:hypothetical protein